MSDKAIVLSITWGPSCRGFDGPCNLTMGVVRYRQNTHYQIEEQNWVTLCPECRAANDEQWEERWKEYYSGVL